MNKITKPGIYKNVDIDDYHNSPGLSSSGIRSILKAPRQYYYEFLTDEGKKKDTKAMKVGRALHTLALEPEEFEKRYHVMPQKIDRRTKAGKAEYAENIELARGKEVIDFDDHEAIKRMAWNLRAHPMFKKMIAKGGYVEHSLMWQDKDTGAMLRARPDFYNDKYIVDIKSSDDATPEGFSRSLYKYGYHHQNALQADGLSQLTGNEYEGVVLFVVENKAPYLCRPYLVKGNAVEQGRAEYKKAAATYKRCVDHDRWEGYPLQVVEIDLPQWAYK